MTRVALGEAVGEVRAAAYALLAGAPAARPADAAAAAAEAAALFAAAGDDPSAMLQLVALGALDASARRVTRTDAVLPCRPLCNTALLSVFPMTTKSSPCGCRHAAEAALAAGGVPLMASASAVLAAARGQDAVYPGSEYAAAVLAAQAVCGAARVYFHTLLCLAAMLTLYVSWWSTGALFWCTSRSWNPRPSYARSLPATAAPCSPPTTACTRVERGGGQGLLAQPSLGRYRHSRVLAL